MKKIIAVFLMAFLCQSSFAWEKVSNSIFVLYGVKVSSTAPESQFKPYAEIAYDLTSDNFKFNYLDKIGLRYAPYYGIFNLRTCRISTTGGFANTSFVDKPSNDQLFNLFDPCNRPVLFRVWDTDNNSAIYRFDKAGPLPVKE